jgi:hypothetical protein
MLQVSADTEVTMCRVNVCWVGTVWKPYIKQVASGRDESDWRGGRVYLYTVGNECGVDERRQETFLKGHVAKEQRP